MGNKTAIITGSSRGIGRAIALKLAKDGMNVVINYVSNETKAIEVVKECEALGVKAIHIKADVSKYNECEEMVKIINDEFETIDVLVNNAGITKDNLLLKMKEEEFDKVISANLKSAFNMTSLVSKIMIKQRYGRIINMSSVAGVYGNKAQVNYSASKAGLIGMTKSASKELGVRNITVNAVAPGFIETEMTDVLSEKIKESIVENTSLKRIGNVDDIAHCVGFLASDNAGYITGQTILVDGGLTI